MSQQLKAEATLDTRQLESGAKRAVGVYKQLDNVGKQAGTSLGKGVSTGADKASFALTNLSRVAQDAPFGFIGIQNNIGPLIDSFGALKKSTGSTGAALKSLAGGLVGPAGLGLAVSLVTSAITYLTMNGFFKSQKAADEAAEAAEKYKKAIEGIFSESAKEAAQTSGLIAVLKSETETRDRKLIALEKLKKINPDIFSQLKEENGLVKGIDAAYAKYIDNFKLVIAAKVTQAEIEGQIIKLLKAQGTTLSSNEKAVANFSKTFAKSQAESLKALGQEGQSAANAVLSIGENLEKAKATEIQNINNEISVLVERLSEFSKGIDLGDATSKATKDIRTIKDVVAELNLELQFLSRREFTFFNNEDVNRITAIRGAVEELIKDFNQTSKSPLIKSLVSDINVLEIRMKEVPKIVERVNQDLQLVIRPRIEPFIGAPEVLKEVIDISEGVSEIVRNTFENILTSLGDGLTDLFSGKSTIGDFFKGIFSQIGTGLQELGKYMILSAQIIKNIKKFLIARPELAIVGGIALIALGGIIKNATAQRDAFATGVRNYGGGVALVGERGPEMVALPRGSSVIPNAQTSSMLGGQQVFIANTVIKGQDLLVTFNRANQSFGRTS